MSEISKRHPIETLWRQVGLPEYFLGNDGSNDKLYALYDAILSVSPAIGEGSRVPSPHEYAMEYEFRGDGDYTPTDAERTMIEDAICGYLGEVSALRSPPERRDAPEPVAEIIAAAVQSVCDWGDRTSPDDYPDHLLITPDELTELLEGVVEAAAVVSPSEPGRDAPEPVAWHCVGSGDGWAEDKITRDRETAEDYARRPRQWRVTPLYASPPDVELVRILTEALEDIASDRGHCEACGKLADPTTNTVSCYDDRRCSWAPRSAQEIARAALSAKEGQKP